jgi:uncharacterized membrane protein YjjP (DUF1212 family)
LPDAGEPAGPLEHARRVVWQRETSPMTLVGTMAPTRMRYKRRRQFRIGEDSHLQDAVDMALRLGAVFLAGGARTDDVEAAVFAAGTALGLERFDVDVTYSAITLSVPPRGRRPGLTTLRVVRSRATHHTRLAAAHDLVVDLTAGRLTRETLGQRLAAVERLPRPYPRWFVTVAWGVLAASLVVRLGGNALTALVAFVSAAVVDRIGRLLVRRATPRFFLNATGALIATSVAVALTAAGAAAQSSLVVAGGIIALLPGMALVVAAQEAMGSFPVTAAARLVELTVATAGVVAGVLGGLVLAAQVGVAMDVADFPTASFAAVVVAVVAAGVASSACAVGYHAPRRVLLAAGLSGASGMATLKAVEAAVATPGAADAVAAGVVGVVGGAVALRRNLPAVLLIVPGIIPMLPGLASYQGLLALSQGDVPEGTSYLIAAVTVALALAAGVLLGELVAGGVARARGWAPAPAETGLLARVGGAEPAGSVGDRQGAQASPVSEATAAMPAHPAAGEPAPTEVGQPHAPERTGPRAAEPRPAQPPPAPATPVRTPILPKDRRPPP